MGCQVILVQVVFRVGVVHQDSPVYQATPAQAECQGKMVYRDFLAYQAQVVTQVWMARLVTQAPVAHLVTQERVVHQVSLVSQDKMV